MSAVRLTHRTAVLAGLVTAGIGLLSLAAWILDAGPLTSLRADYIPMAPLTAVLFSLLGLALAAEALWPTTRVAPAFASAVAAVALLSAGLILLQSVTALTLPWDGWLVAGSVHAEVLGAGRVSPVSALVFLLSAPLLHRPMTRAGRGRVLRFLVFGGAGTGLLICLVVTVSYGAGAPLLYGVGAVPMALLTACTLTTYNLGLIFLRSGGSLAREWRDDERLAEMTGQERVSVARFAAAGLALALLLALLGFYYLRNRQAAARDATVGQLEAVAMMKAREIASWRHERIADARFLSGAKAVAEDVATILETPANLAAMDRLRELLGTIKGGDRYESVQVFTPSGERLVALPDVPALGPTEPPAALATAARARDIVFADIHSDAGTLPHIEILAPIQSPRDASGVIAVIVLRIDPRSVLFPLVREWPLAALSAESYLVRRNGDQVEFLSDLRYASATPLPPRSINDDLLSAALALQGRAGGNEARDYRGVPVVFASRPIPGSSWTVVAEVDQVEAYAPARREAWLGAGLVAVLLLAVGQAVLFVWRRRQAEFLRRALLAEQDLRATSERLALVTRHANDVVILFDQKGRIIEANDRCLTVYGRPPEAMCRLTAGDLRLAEDAQAAADAFASVLASDGKVFATFHRRADGSRFPVEVSARPVTIQGDRYVLSINRDITERRAQEEEIERLTRLYSALSQVNEAIVRAHDRDILFTEVCKSLVEAGGFELAWVGWRDPVSHEVHAASVFGDRTGYLESLQIRQDGSGFGKGVTGGVLRENRIVVRNDFLSDPGTEPWREAATRAGIRASISLPIQAMGQTVAALNVYAREVGVFREKEIALLREAAADITFGLENLDREEKRLAADASLLASLREKEALLKEVHHRVKNNLQIILSLLRLETSRASELATTIVLRDMQGRIHSMALLHETLYRSGNFARVDLADYLGHLATHVARSHGFEPSRVARALDPVQLGIDQAIPCGLIVTELVTNAFKYGIPTSGQGQASLSLRVEGGERIVLEVNDRGPGLPADFEARRSRSLGLQLVSDLARQLGGRLEIESARGATFRVTFPAPQLAGVTASLVRSTG